MGEQEELYQKEIDVSEEEELFLKKRLKLMHDSLEDLSSEDPAFFTLQYQIEADHIALDELKRRREELAARLKKT